ncbi:MAG: penicillin-binding protein 1C [Campylobacter sp.]|nr:penicillin-binding protein 1C [Campylobacter sp.]
MKKTAVKICKFCMAFLLICFCAFLLLDRLFPLNLAMLNKPVSQILYDEKGKIISMKISNDEIWRFHAQTSEIPQNLKQSVLFFEDRHFYRHFGVNFFSLFRAFAYNFTHNSTQRLGASTITMQVARMMNPKERTYANKIIEIFNAFQLEFHYTKDEILTMYFNLAPYGGNIEGVKTASYFYFGKNLNELSIAQSALLSVIPKNPNKNRLDKISNIKTLKNRLVNELFMGGVINENEKERALNEPFSNQRLSYANYAPHYANLAFINGVKKANLNLEIQSNLENFIKNEILNLKSKSVANGSAVLIDNEKMAVVAYIGSHDFNAKFGQNDGVKTPKNVGSTLKPFIYAKALETGIITPLTKLVDTQLYFHNYTPKNYDDNFYGIVSATDALGFSLNIPAVKLNSVLGESSLFYLLQKANLTQFSPEFYGAGIALGGISLSLLDLTHLYTAFAKDGRLLPLEVAGHIIDKNEQILSPQSAYITAIMLENAPRSYLNSVWKNTENKPNLLFKTGTSAGARDLYTIAVTPKFTLGIWLGNFDGSKTNDLSGGVSAAKIAFNMFDYLDKNYEIAKFNAPKGVEAKKICTDFYYETECKNEREDLVISGVDRNLSCEIYKNEELFYLLQNNFLDTKELENGRCGAKFKSLPPILNDLDKKKFQSQNSEKINLKIHCTAIFGDEIFISFDDGNYTQVPNSTPFFKEFNIGKHSIKCLDNYSNLTIANFEVF